MQLRVFNSTPRVLRLTLPPANSASGPRKLPSWWFEALTSFLSTGGEVEDRARLWDEQWLGVKKKLKLEYVEDEEGSGFRGKESKIEEGLWSEG